MKPIFVCQRIDFSNAIPAANAATNACGAVSFRFLVRCLGHALVPQQRI